MKKPGEVFEDASVYDPGIEAIVPRYDELHDAVLNSPPQDRSADIRVLELGTGTGELTAKLLTRFPESRVLAVDHSEKMLAEAERKLEAFEDRVTIEAGEFPTEYPPTDAEFDLVISTLAIHHLDDADKRLLYERVFDVLAPGGWFVNGDVVKFNAAHLEDVADEMIESWMRSKGWSEDAFMSEWQASDDYDDPSTLLDQLNWLDDAGFEGVTSIWQYYNFAVFGGRKPAE